MSLHREECCWGRNEQYHLKWDNCFRMETKRCTSVRCVFIINLIFDNVKENISIVIMEFSSCYCSHVTVPRGISACFCGNTEGCSPICCFKAYCVQCGADLLYPLIIVFCMFPFFDFFKSALYSSLCAFLRRLVIPPAGH